MQFLTALLAFAGVMALLSTIIAVAIEAYVNARGMRRSGLERLLAGYYREAVLPRLPPDARPAEADVNRAASAFASAMTRNPARLGRSGNGRGAPFQHLTTRQLVEQLARTPAGGSLLALEDRELRPRLEALAYEFDRYSDGARTFFTRRTRAFAVAIAILFAFALNVDALRLYKVLATDPSTREAIIRWADTAMAEESAAERLEGLPPPAGVEDGEASDISRLVSLLGTMSIPVGYSQYPYCLEYSPLHGVVSPGSVVFDPRCAQVRNRVERFVQRSTPQGRAIAAAQTRGSSLQPEWAIALGEMGNTMFSWAPEIYRARIHFDTWVWFFSTLVAGGMIGLGAPFWFNVYRSIAMLIPVAGAASAIASQLRRQPAQSGDAASAATPTPGRRDDANVRGGDSLVVVARTAAGQSPDVPAVASPQTTSGSAGPAGPVLTGSSPPGGAIGPGSAQRVAAGAASAPASSGEAFQLRRRLRG